MQHFIDAQDPHGPGVLTEWCAGRKIHPWSWLVSPPIDGLGESVMPWRYARSGVEQDQSHWQQGARLRACLQAMLPHVGRLTVQTVIGAMESLKLRSMSDMVRTGTS